MGASHIFCRFRQKGFLHFMQEYLVRSNVSQPHFTEVINIMNRTFTCCVYATQLTLDEMQLAKGQESCCDHEYYFLCACVCQIYFISSVGAI